MFWNEQGGGHGENKQVQNRVQGGVFLKTNV